MDECGIDGLGIDNEHPDRDFLCYPKPINQNRRCLDSKQKVS